MSTDARRRLVAAVAAALTVALGLGVRLLFAGPFAKYAGDALYTVLIYWLIVVIRPGSRPLWLAVGISWLIEFAQLLEIPRWLQPLLGSTFNAPDLLFYAVGGVLARLVHSLWITPRRP
ncbi:MAG: DUF2809 domain-containing protein [Nonomuraea sp.]|nr:DUF2809 domain-containing protein [Nonomuraea sp.]